MPNSTTLQIWTPSQSSASTSPACEARDLAGASALFAPDFTSITATGEEFHVSTQLANLKSFFEEYSDIELSVHTMIACDDRVVTRYTHH